MGLFDRITARLQRRDGAPAEGAPAPVPAPVPAPAPAPFPSPSPAASAQDPHRLIAEGNAAEDQGRPRDALRLYDEAIALDPGLSKAHVNRGIALMALGDAAAAVQAYDAAVRLDPQSASAHYNLGLAHSRGSRYDEALAAYRRALALRPEFAEAEVALGVVHEELGQAAEAAACYRRALRIRPDYAPVHGNLAEVLAKLGQLEPAVASYRRALELNPQLTALHFGLANGLQGLGDHEGAVASYRLLLQSHADFAPAFGMLGHSLAALGRREEALVAYRRAVMLDPTQVDAHCMLGNLLAEQGHLHEALGCYERMLQIEPRNVLAHNNMGGVFRRLGRMEDAAASYERALAIDADLAAALSNLLFIRNSLADRPSMELLTQARRFGELAARAARPFTLWRSTPVPERPLRIGLVSGDLCSHPVGYFLDSVLASLVSQAAGRLELAAYFNRESGDEVSDRIGASCRLWCPVANLSDEALAMQIHSDGIDILIDLSGHTSHTRVQAFAWKPAPVQVTWLGYLATTGVQAIDYVIADAWTLPADEEPFFTERVWRLPESYLCFTPPAEAGEVGPLPALGNGTVTFGSFNNLSKVTDAVIGLWARVLHAVPASRLLLKAQQLQVASVRQEVIAKFAAHGIASERLMLEGLVPRAEYLRPFQRVDIALDPFPYPGITTSVECLWMGVPVLTLAGQTFFARQGVGLLMNAGLPDWIATDEDDYVARAARHAGDLRTLQALRQRLRPQVLASPIFDAPRFARNLESALRGLWREWCSRQAPA